MIEVSKIKKDFPVFKNQPDLIYLDSAATSLKPKKVIEKIIEYYQKYPANIHRGIYSISEKATLEYEKTREVIGDFIGGKSSEIVFTRNTTESLNILAEGLTQRFTKRGDEILISIMEHHSNFVPWQVVSKKKGLKLKILDIDKEGKLEISKLKKLITKKTKIVSLSYVSNVLGTINPIKKISEIIKKKNKEILFVVDAAQAVPHFKVKVKDLGIDFLAFSGHKMLGPTGAGVLWGKEELLNEISPLNYGGGMIEKVEIEKTIFQKAPFKFEAGTPDISAVIALKEAVFYLEKIGMEEIEDHEKTLTNLAMEKLKKEFGKKIKIYGPKERASVISFNFKNYHPHDVSQILAKEKICIRAGHHCAMPLHKRLKILATCRASFYLYNSKEDVEKLIEGLKKVEKTLG
jgi:cysteine desulfurase / selenocysteine lyase